MWFKKRQNYSVKNQAALIKNGIRSKQWVAAGGNPCDICRTNAAQGPIPTQERFMSGHLFDPAHDGCECYVNGVADDLSSMTQDQLSSLITWDKKA